MFSFAANNGTFIVFKWFKWLSTIVSDQVDERYAGVKIGF